MHLRIIDYAANPGGGVRFAAETIGALARVPGLHVDVVSSGAGLDRYARQLGGAAGVRLLDVPPANARAVRGRRFAGAPIVPSIGRALGLGFCFHYDVPAAAMDPADVVWFPWLHSHRLPPGDWRVVGSLHDVILLEFGEQFGAALADDEERTLRTWMSSTARIVVSSRATAAILQGRLGAPSARLDLVPLSGQHDARRADPALRPEWTFAERPFLLCPANISPHKNHEVLLDALSLLRERLPLVLTGPGTELRSRFGRARALRRRAAARRLVLGRDVVGVGYASDAEYYALLRRASALVMPTLAEGGESFPVWEALFEGVPVVCSDIPVMREMLDRVGGEVLWFDPRDAAHLRDRLQELRDAYDLHRQRALEQRVRLRPRTWDEVGREYLRIFSEASARGAPAGAVS